MLHWIYSVLWQMQVLSGLWGLVGLAFILLLYLVFPKAFQRVFDFLMKYKGLILLFMFVFQLALLFSSQLMIRRDAAVVFRGAFFLSEAQSISNYLTRNPNNLALFLYERFFYQVFGDGGLWVLQGLNTFYVYLTTYILYKGGQVLYGQKLADRVFAFFVLLMGFSPYFMAMYTDVFILPLVALQLVLAIALFKDKDRGIYWLPLFSLGLVSALAMLFRPPTLILLMAFMLVYVLRKKWKQGLLTILLLSLSFAGPYYLLKKGLDHQDQVQLLEGKGLAKGPLLFINLGLTYTGTNQSDMKKGLLAYLPEEERDNYNNGMFAQENVKKEIVRRLKDYTPKTFLDHLEYKERWSVMDGTLDWIYFSDVSKEKTAFVSPLYESLKGPVTQWIRQHFISYDHPDYRLWAIFKQVIWVMVSLGMLMALLRFYPEDDRRNVLILALFGALLFLTIFEGGKTRYLIQFLPQILFLSALGWEDATAFLERRKRSER